MALPTKTAAQIITAFELQVDDLTELSSVESLLILDRVYQRLCADRPWEFLKTNATGSILNDANGYYIDLPENFAYLAENNQPTLNDENIYNNASPKVIFVGPNYSPVQIINFSDRRQYRNNNAFAYIDIANNQIRFLANPGYTTYDFDYIKVPDVLEADSVPVLPGRFHDMLAYAMAIENDILQLSEKARSYMNENSAKYKEDFNSLVYWNAQFFNN